MNSKELERELTQLKSEADRLAGEELDGTGDRTERYKAARSLNDRLISLRAQVDSAPAADGEELDDIWQAAERNLIFLLFSADQAETSADQAETLADQAEAATPKDLPSLARQLSTEAFELGKTMLAGQVELSELQAKVLELDKRLKELAHRPGNEAPDVQKALSDADLDLTFVYEGGKAPMSLRMHRFIQSLN